LTEDLNGKSSMEAARLADRQEGPAQSKPFLQATVAPALVNDGLKHWQKAIPRPA
jgi:hypothetical protein